ncbi:hypothetical protein C3495_07265 [Clostridiaceae bacterium 14S0207]|nr:hypothetical protein C3495_07265 [Clostridiaceae bacterium 14S0207]
MNQMIIQNQCTNDNISNNSYVEILNLGWYFAEFYITYIAANGEQITDDSGVFSLGQTRRLYIAGGTTQVILKVEVWIFGKDVILFNDFIDTRNSNCFELHGTIFYPTMRRMACSDSNSNNCSCCCKACCKSCCSEDCYRNLCCYKSYCCKPYCNKSCCNYANDNCCCNKCSCNYYNSYKFNSFKNI